MTTANINHINLVGRLGQNPDIRYFESGKVITKINLAVNRNSKDESPDWFEVQLWNKAAEIAGNYTTKGSLVGIEGELKLEEWVDKNTGIQRSKPVIIATRLELLSTSNSKQDDEF